MYLNIRFGAFNLTQRVKITQGFGRAKRLRAVEARFFCVNKKSQPTSHDFNLNLVRTRRLELPRAEAH